MKQLAYYTVGESRGNARVWLEGLYLEQCGFTVGSFYRTHIDLESRTITIETSETGNKVSRKAKKRGGQDFVPVVDLCNKDITEVFGSFQKVRAQYFDGKIVLTVHHLEKRRVSAIESLKANLAKGEITEGTLCAGGGISNRALHEGFERAGLKSQTMFIADIEGDFMQVAVDNSPAVNNDTMLVVGGLNEIEADLLPQVNVLSLSLPCVGFSTAGKARNKITNGESHSKAGIVFLGALSIIEKTKPAFIIGENVRGYQGSVTEQVVNARLSELSYTVESRVISGADFGCLEDRVRHIWVATLEGVEFDPNDLPVLHRKPANLGEALEPVPADSPRWKEMAYLDRKEKSDIANGKWFRRQRLDGSATSIGVCGAGYFKCRSTEPMVKHPTNDSLTRLLTPVERERCQQVPEGHTAGFSEVTAHTVLGNSVSYSLFVSLGFSIAKQATEQVVRITTQPVRQIRELVKSPANDGDQVNAGQLALFA